MTTNQSSTWRPPHRPHRAWIWRTLIIGLLEALTLMLLARWVDGVAISGLGSAVAAVVFISVCNSVLWPIVIRFTATFIALTVGLLAFVLNGVFIGLAARFVPGFSIDSLGDGILVAMALSTVAATAGSLLSLNDDGAWQRLVLSRAMGSRGRVEPTDQPGILFFQIDGLSHQILTEAIEAGHAPTLKSMLDDGTHHLTEWECDLSSQTGAMQCGIMFGNNHNVPAFRWYDRESKKILVSNHPRDAAHIERSQSDGNGLLAGGASRGNVFSGDATEALYTFSRLGDPGPGLHRSLVALFASPDRMLRMLGLFVAEIVREWRDNWRAKRDPAALKGHRGGIYPLLRAGVTVGLAEITSATLAGDIQRGVSVSYVDFVGYDEVAHHSGIRRPESLAAIETIDEHIRRICLGFDGAPRPYEVVVLSDHGQSEGPTFTQRYHYDLKALVSKLADTDQVFAPAAVTEGWGNVNGVLTDVVNDNKSLVARGLRSALASRTHNGQVEVGPDSFRELDKARDEGKLADNIVVLASGNLGLVSFPEFDDRVTLEELAEKYPRLVAGLATHAGVGFVAVRSESDGAAVAIGRNGVHHLADGRVDGEDPLAPYGPNAARHLARTDSFTNCPDLIVMGAYDPETGDGNAFEELVGFHGGLGGLQTRPFILAPKSMKFPDEPIVGAEAVHQLFAPWAAATTKVSRLPEPAP